MTADPPSGPRQLTGGSCFGFGIESDLGFNYLRKGTGESLDILEHARRDPESDGELLIDWPVRPGRPAHVRLFRDVSPLRYSLWISDAGWYLIDPSAPRIEIPTTTNEIRREERLWGMPSLLCFSHRGDLPLHAAAIEVDGSAILLGGPSRHGKTTLAAAFWEAGYRLLAEDLSRVRLNPIPAVIPGPAMLRIRKDVAARLDVSGVEIIGSDEERLHLALEKGRAGNTDPVPIRGFVLLQLDAEGVLIESVRPMEALRDLWILTFHLPDDQQQVRVFQQITDFASRVPVWRLSRPLRFDALDQTIDAILSAVLDRA